MVNTPNTLRLLAMPALWMGAVQFLFGAVALVLHDDSIAESFLIPGAVTVLLAGTVHLVLRTRIHQISYRDALVFATLTWVLTGVLGALPIRAVTGVSFTDAVFESISALTTTGATVLNGLDDMPSTFLMYRQFLQWMGGLGVVIFVVAVLPMLNVGGMRLLKAETSGPIKDDKLSPRVTHAAHSLWLVYILITLGCAVAFFLGGMSVFDAIAHSFSTVSTGGFSTHDASLGHFDSHLILNIANLFMLLGAISFGLHYRILLTREVSRYWRDEETRVFLLSVAAISLLLALYLLWHQRYHSFWEALSFATFHLVSFITSTGFGDQDLTTWPVAAPVALILAGYLGGCAGSTAGGSKFIRNIIAFKTVRSDAQRLLHPSAVKEIRFQRQIVAPDVRHAVMAFFSFVAASSLLFTLALMATGLDLLSAFSAVAACLNVLGPGLGQVGSNFQVVSDTGIWLLSAAMIIGRLEYFTVLALFFPVFWRY
ncbi:TrkH family potassium uptake protein [Parahaliea mediterranea]|uniref:TrkH family potassium uptake protein n=1 Tax=Parahaliea mediterranea TaxID=651086 RepID=UPI000E2E7EAC|nr:potassium transporter TrkG [Parahaliea mediterranea]